MALIGQAVSEKKIFEILDDGRTTDAGTWVYYKLNSAELKFKVLINTKIAQINCKFKSRSPKPVIYTVLF